MKERSQSSYINNPTMKRKAQKKRFNTAQAITREIDLYKDKAAKFLGRAEALDQEARGYIESGRNLQLAEDRQLEAKRYRKKVYNIEVHRLPFLARKLAAFQTELLPGVITDGDRSVSARGES